MGASGHRPADCYAQLMRVSVTSASYFFMAAALCASAGAVEPLVLTNANLIDGLAAEVQPLVTVVVENGKITEISATADRVGARRIDLAGRYLLPGLIDGHVHIASSRAARKALESGITTARSMGVSNYADVGLRDLEAKGVIASPELFAAGYHLRPQVAEAMFLDATELADLWTGISGAASYRRATAVNLDHGVDWIKIASTERAGLPDTDPRKQTMLEVEIAAIVDEAGKRRVPVAAHAHGDEGGWAAVAAGVRSIEHGTYLSRETLELMKEKSTFLVPTLAVVQDLVEPGGDYDDPVLRVRGRHMLPRLMEVVATAHELGVPIVAATDTGFGAHSTLTLQHEIEMLVVAGLSPAEAIAAATSMAARLLGIEDRTGAIAVGMEADLLVVDRNPLEDVLALQDVLLLVSDGEVIVDRLDFGLD